MKEKGIIGMAPGLRVAHGNAADGGALIVSETLPADEIARLAVHEPEVADARGERSANGRFRAGSNTSQRKGGKARKGISVWARSMGLDNLTSNPTFKAELAKSKAWVREQRKAYAMTYGGGVCGVAPSTLIVNAAWMQAASRALLASEDLDPKVILAASNLADKARTALLTASQLCATEAKSQEKKFDPWAALRAEPVPPSPTEEPNQ